MIKDSFCGDKEVSYTGIMADTSIHTPDTPGVDLGSSSHSLSYLHFFHTFMSNVVPIQRLRKLKLCLKNNKLNLFSLIPRLFPSLQCLEL